ERRREPRIAGPDDRHVGLEIAGERLAPIGGGLEIGAVRDERHGAPPRLVRRSRIAYRARRDAASEGKPAEVTERGGVWLRRDRAGPMPPWVDSSGVGRPTCATRDGEGRPRGDAPQRSPRAGGSASNAVGVPSLRGARRPRG